MNAFNVFLTLQTALPYKIMKCFGHRSNTPRHDNSFYQNSEILRFVAQGQPWQSGIFNVPYACHYKPRLVYFFTPFPKTIYEL